jgi:predicted RNase H-like HicB family nuclease
MAFYVALIHKDASSDFSVSFPDFPGCVTAGTTIEEARVMAEEALVLHIEGMMDDGSPIPAPSSLDEIMEVRENKDAVAFIVDAKIAERAIRINVSIPERELRAIDAYAQMHGLSRSSLLLKAAKLAIADDRL